MLKLGKVHMWFIDDALMPVKWIILFSIIYYVMVWLVGFFFNRELWIGPLYHLKGKKIFSSWADTTSFHFPVKFFILLGTE